MAYKDSTSERPYVGIGVLIFNEGHLLLGKRKNSHGNGSWGLPGGHLEFGETPESCGHREVLEETGLTLKNMQRGPFVNNIFPENNRQYITLFLKADVLDGVPQLLEPEKCEQWRWFPLDNLPTNLFLPLAELIAQDRHWFAAYSSPELFITY